MAVLPEARVASAEEFARPLEAIRVAHADEETPHLFDGCYELHEVFGAWAKAEVYRAYHRDARRYVARPTAWSSGPGAPCEHTAGAAMRKGKQRRGHANLRPHCDVVPDEPDPVCGRAQLDS
ncbi:hypothetical protein OV079_34050 [Nannocystis pusilla]|uniref:Uncharacterized protein n=1 Tax=Nannocystis pusilla TaxID=889268 RepID=A0A9X3F2Z1_9BACT|nr:hypothetical protein [Nannocystis pusilla]MCY1010503.1 hypothetical protein [Nannocystis pusilla]